MKEIENITTDVQALGLPRLLIIGCGDVGMRLLPLVRDRFRVFALTSQPSRRQELRDAGAIPVVADLDDPPTLARLARLAPTVIHLAPPQADGKQDRRTRRLAAILPERTTLVYISTTGVYGDCGGAFFDETRPVHPRNPRAQRRVDAECTLRQWGRRAGRRLVILRVPGIYAADRLPLDRLRKGLPALIESDDVFTNHIHADDLARIIAASLRHGFSNRVYHAVDDTELKMADYFDVVADAFGLPRPPRLDRQALEKAVSPMQLSFMSESRRLDNARMKKELGIALRYTSVMAALPAMVSAHSGTGTAR